MATLAHHIDASACLPTIGSITVVDAGWASGQISHEKAVLRRDLANLKAISRFWSQCLSYLDVEKLEEVTDIIDATGLRDFGPITPAHLNLARNATSFTGTFVNQIPRLPD